MTFSWLDFYNPSRARISLVKLTSTQCLQPISLSAESPTLDMLIFKSKQNKDEYCLSFQLQSKASGLSLDDTVTSMSNAYIIFYLIYLFWIEFKSEDKDAILSLFDTFSSL